MSKKIQKLTLKLKNEYGSMLSTSQKERLRPLYNKIIGQSRKIGYVVCENNEKVTDKDISVVIQGQITAATAECINSVRNILPNAEIIVSTWEGSDISGLNCDKIITSPDPGSDGLIRRYPFKQINNTNREITSSFAGANAATRKYCLKIRSDMKIISDKFLKYYNSYSQYIAPDAIVERRIMVDGLTTTPRDLSWDVGDWSYFGTTCDIRRLFDITPYPSETKPYFEMRKNLNKKPMGGDLVCRFIPEQYIISRFIKEHAPIEISSKVNISHAYDGCDINFYKEWLAGNILCLEFSESGIILPKACNINNNNNNTLQLVFNSWWELCQLYRTLPKVKKILSDKRRKQAQKEYRKNPTFYGIQSFCNVIENYSKRTEVIEYEIEKNIKDEDITFVVSGLIGIYGSYDVITCLSSIRQFFPKSPIILSTWEGEPYDKIKKELYDEIVILPEPKEETIRVHLKGSIHYHRQSTVNRQQLLVNEGFKRVKTKYSVRMRTDFYLTGRDFLDFYLKWTDTLNKTDKNFRIFKQRVIAYKYATWNPRFRNGGYSFCLSDIFHFGLTEDLLKLWDGHQTPKHRLNYFYEHPNSRWYNPDMFNQRHVEEQNILINVVRKYLKLKIPKWYNDNSTDEFIFETEKVLAANVLIAGEEQLGFHSKFYGSKNLNNIYDFRAFLVLYLHNVDPTNQECLNYLKKEYEVHKTSRVFRFFLCIENAVHAVFKGIKFVMRCILPAYRVGCGTRDILLQFQTEQRDSVNYLHYKIDKLSGELDKKTAEIKKLNKRLEKMQGQSNDKSK